MPSFQEIARALEGWAPPALQESYDNAGLICGEPGTPCTGVLVNLDVTEALLDEALARGCNLIVTHHPIWFGPRKRLNGEDYVSRILLKAIRHGIGLYAIHTNLDNVRWGVNARMAAQLGLQNQRLLSEKPATLACLVTHVPLDAHGRVLEALFAAGAGTLGAYTEASFSSTGTTTFRPGENARPVTGEKGLRYNGHEQRIEVVFPEFLRAKIVRALLQAHPYEVPAWHVYKTETALPDFGAGMIGTLPQPLSKQDFLEMVKQAFGCGGIRYADAHLEQVQTVAVCGGAGSFLTGQALRAGADAFVTGDITYHKFFDNEDRMLLLDIGHYESEQFTSGLICDFLSGNFPNFAVLLSGTTTNPVKYY